MEKAEKLFKSSAESPGGACGVNKRSGGGGSDDSRSGEGSESAVKAKKMKMTVAAVNAVQTTTSATGESPVNEDIVFF